jgi:hypothetical protein
MFSNLKGALKRLYDQGRILKKGQSLDLSICNIHSTLFQHSTNYPVQ